MTKTLWKLQWTLWLRSFKRSKTQVILNVMLLIYLGPAVLGATAWVGWAMHEGVTAREIMWLPLTGALVYILLEVMWAFSDDQLRPEVLGTLPLTPRQVLPTVIATALVTSRGLAYSLFKVGTIGAALIFGGAQGALFALISVGAFISGFLATQWLSSISIPNWLTAVLILGISFTPMLFQAFDVSFGDLNLFGTSAQWLPFGGYTTVLGIPLFAWFLYKALEEAMAEPARSHSKKASLKGSERLLVPGAKPTVGGALFSRQVRYWWRDSRTKNFWMFPVMVLAFMFFGAKSDVSFLKWYGLFFVATGCMQSSSNIFGLDGPSNWVHMTAGVEPKTMFHARAAATAVLMLPTSLAFVIGAAFLMDFKTWLIATVAVVSVMIMSGGLGSIFSAVIPFAAPKPGGNPWKNGGSTSGRAFASVFTGMAAPWIPLLPGSALMLINPFPGAILLGAVISLGIAAAIYIAGVNVAVKKLDWPSVFAYVRNWTSA